MTTSSYIVPMRFRIDETYLKDLAVSFSSFAYEQDCKNFIDSMGDLTSRDHPESVPYQRLNTVLTALAPTLAHPFISQRNADTGKSERQMLVVGTDVVRRPKPEQISDLLYEWGKQWGQRNFEQEIKGTGRDAHQRLLDRLQQPAQQWQETDAASLFLHLDAGTRTGYRAIPSILASLLAGKESRINQKTVKWRLAQDGDDGLGVISNPFQAEYAEENPFSHIVEVKTGTFAYKLEFRLQTQIGSPHRWIHLYVRCSRYVDEHLTGANWKRDVSVKVGVDLPRLSGWGWSPTLVTLPLTGGAKNARWDDYLVPLLSAMKARDLITPNLLLQAPQNYRKATPLSLHDEYFVLHAEGFKPQHKVKTGFDFAELREVANSVSDLLGLELSAGQTLVSDIPKSQMYLSKLPLTMCTLDNLQKKAFIKRNPQETEDDNKKHNKMERQKIIIEGFRRTTNNQPLFILLCWDDALTKTTLEQKIRQALFLEEHDSWPDEITLIIPSTPTPPSLLEPLDPGTLNPSDHFKPNVPFAERRKFLKKWKTQMRLAFRAKTQAWERYLKDMLPDGPGYGLALIELHKLNEINPDKVKSTNFQQYHSSQNIKGAVRRACNKLGLASQMIFPMKQNKEGKIGQAHQYRARNSVIDLLYRQTGLVYDKPTNLYIKAGIPQEQAKCLSVIALYKLRKNDPKINYPMAVRLSPDGTFQALLPQHSHQWLPLLEARKVLGELFMKGKEQGTYLHLDPQAQAQFAAQVLTARRNEPTLVLLEAQDWRNYNVLPQFANGKRPLKDQLDLVHVKTFERLYSREDLPNLRIIRVRTIGSSGETPQYFTVLEDEEDEFKEDKDLGHLTGFIDTQTDSEFFHYLSIGRMPTTAAKEQQKKPGFYKTDEGGGIAFKHQTIVEFVPFFLQEGDDPQVWCHIPHFLRISPGWDGGNIVLPYPMHLAKCMIDDQLCIIENNGDWEEADE